MNALAPVLFRKAAVHAPGQADLFAEKVEVSGHMRGGKYVPAFRATRHKRPSNERPIPKQFAHAADHPHMDMKLGDLAAAHGGVVGHIVAGKVRGDLRYKAGKFGLWAKDDDGKTKRIMDLGQPSGHSRLRDVAHAVSNGLAPSARYEPVQPKAAKLEKPVMFKPPAPAAPDKPASAVKEEAPPAAAKPPASDNPKLPSISPGPGEPGYFALKHNYVSAIDRERSKSYVVAGPYASHDEAKAQVWPVSQKAAEGRPESHWYHWGVSGSDEHIKTPLGENWKPEESAKPTGPARVPHPWEDGPRRGVKVDADGKVFMETAPGAGDHKEVTETHGVFVHSQNNKYPLSSAVSLHKSQASADKAAAKGLAENHVVRELKYILKR